MENAEEIGLSRLAAAVIYEMPFCGFMDEEVEAERQKLSLIHIYSGWGKVELFPKMGSRAV